MDQISREARIHIGGGQYAGPERASNFVHVGIAGQDTLARVERLLAGIPGGVEKAVRSAASRASARLRSASVKAIRERYAISAANVRANENIQIRYDYRNGVRVSVCFYGRLIPLHRFDGAAPSVPTPDTSRRFGVMHGFLAGGEEKWHLMYPGVPAHGHVLKGTSPATFPHAFVARMNSTGHIGIYERTKGMTSRGKDEIEELFGPSVPEMLGSQEVAEKLVKEASDSFEKNLEHNINAILYGYMGVSA